jgi:hypothetical protein
MAETYGFGYFFVMVDVAGLRPVPARNLLERRFRDFQEL